ncbi:aaa family atpase [Fusarium albosuccineum]|uniref:Aaa family atpase n=1 Tax=Fusarium albosuccineum TaxID=1237068 RepID=A0A8H4P751_9HYPO|nr:aaa family atpase [Fusarium albosuccineum]
MLAESIDAKVRPLANTSLEKSSLLGAARIYVSKDSLLSLIGTLENGKHCLIKRLPGGGSNNTNANEDGPQDDLQREASLWILPEKNLSPNVVMMTRAFQDATGFKIGDLVRISLAGTTPDAEEVVVRDVTERIEKTASDFDKMEKLEKEEKYSPGWEFSVASFLIRAEQVFPGMVLEAVTGTKVRRNFKVISVNSRPDSVARFCPASTTIRITDANELNAEANGEPGGDLVITGVPGMATQIKVLNAFLRVFTRQFYFRGERSSCGFVIHGGPGTGKTLILNRIAETKWGRVHWIKPSDKIATIRETLSLAQTQQPSMILMDDFDALINKDRSNRDSIIDAICETLDGLSATARSSKALPQVVVVATCSDYPTDIPAKLQKTGRFVRNVALPIPGTSERLEILSSFDAPIRPEEKQSLLMEVAQRTHAYSPQDLDKLMEHAKEVLGDRLQEQDIDPLMEQDHFLQRADLEQATKATQPTAMHDINLHPPTIHWQDVGGQDALKKALNRMIKYTKNPERSLRPPPKGLLLYGPPGCSKTLSAQAAATESGFNFFAVKGAELLNMYVGESERAVRTLFGRARNASPSIIFFDEIDSIGGQRTGSGSATRSTGAVNMLTTLLTEMDGFETLSGVLVLAATNRPEAMDPALMRPGRFDQVLYVGPPDGPAREAIFKVHLRGLPLSSDIDIPELARLAEGFSGAEIKAICNETCMMVQDRYEDNDTANKLELSMADVTAVLEKTPRNITKHMIDGYEKWSKQFKKV